MTDFKNKFSWSISQDRTFQTCKRKYYLNRYGSWGGWEKDADETTRKIYILKHQTTIPMLVGDVVHQTISKILDSCSTSIKILFNDNHYSRFLCGVIPPFFRYFH